MDHRGSVGRIVSFFALIALTAVLVACSRSGDADSGGQPSGDASPTSPEVTATQAVAATSTAFDRRSPPLPLVTNTLPPPICTSSPTRANTSPCGRGTGQTDRASRNAAAHGRRAHHGFADCGVFTVTPAGRVTLRPETNPPAGARGRAVRVGRDLETGTGQDQHAFKERVIVTRVRRRPIEPRERLNLLTVEQQYGGGGGMWGGGASTP